MTPDEVTRFLAQTGTGLGLFSSTIGIANIVIGWRARRVVLEVRVGITYLLPPSGRVGATIPGHLTVTVVNHSAFPVTIAKAGMHDETKRGFVQQPGGPTSHDGKPLPQKLDPRDSLDVYLTNVREVHEGMRGYAVTACGRTKYGNRRDILTALANPRLTPPS